MAEVVKRKLRVPSVQELEAIEKGMWLTLGVYGIQPRFPAEPEKGEVTE